MLSLDNDKYIILYKTDGSEDDPKAYTLDGTVQQYATWQEAADRGIELFNDGEYTILQIKDKEIIINPKS